MCGRFTLIRLSDFTNLFPWILPPDSPPSPRYNIAPAQPVAVVPNKPRPKVEFMHWGLIPSWAKDPAIGNRMINARAETLAEKPSFRTALRRRRCLIPADGFYEWRKDPGGKTKTPMFIRLKSGRPFAFAGLWDIWHDPGGSAVTSFTIITTTPNELMKTIHDRMPVILPEDHYRQWLAPGEAAAEDLQELLAPYPTDQMSAVAVSRAVNNPGHDARDCIEPTAQLPEPTAPPDSPDPPAKAPTRGRGRRRPPLEGGLFPGA